MFLVLIGILINTHIAKTQSAWDVPDDKNQKASPFKFDKESQKKGDAIYQRNCVSCHGLPSKNNFVALMPPPGDPAQPLAGGS